MAYAHYALMGGFAAYVEDIHNALKRVTLTSNGLLFLAKNGFFCCLDPGDIEDKSKADYLAKGLVCVQVVWIVCQAIERKIANLPTTILEAHTIVHTICALVMYALWYQKPLNLTCPMVVDFGENRDLLAFMLEASAPRERHSSNNLSPPTRLYKYASLGDTTDLDFHKSGFKTTLTRRHPFSTNYEPRICIAKPECVITDPPISISVDGSVYQYSLAHLQTDLSINYGMGTCDWSFVPSEGEICYTLLPNQCLESISFFAPSNHAIMYFCEVSLTMKDLHRLRLVGRAWKRFDPTTIAKALPNNYGRVIPINRQIYEHLGISQPLTSRCANASLTIPDTVTGTPRIVLWTAFAVIPGAYGGVHLTVLSLLFSTTIERLLWRISCYYLITFAGFAVLFSADPLGINSEDHLATGTLPNGVAQNCAIGGA